MKSLFSYVGASLTLVACVLGCGASHPTQTERTVIVQATSQPSNGDTAIAAEQIHVIVDRDRGSGEMPPPPPPPPPPAPPAAMVDQLVGQKVRVQFRRDALGLVADAPTSPLNGGLPKRPVYLDGTLKQVGHDGAILEAESRTIWIPWSSILLIESSDH